MAEPIVIDAMMAKVEVTYGTDPTPGLGHGRPGPGAAPSGARRSTSRTTFPNERDDVVVGAWSRRSCRRRRRVPQWAVVQAVVRGGAAAEGQRLRGGRRPAGRIGALIRACGHSATVATSGIDFTPIHQLHESATIWFYAGGNLYKMVGCQGRYEVGLQRRRAGPAAVRDVRDGPLRSGHRGGTRLDHLPDESRRRASSTRRWWSELVVPRLRVGRDELGPGGRGAAERQPGPGAAVPDQAAPAAAAAQVGIDPAVDLRSRIRRSEERRRRGRSRSRCPGRAPGSG
jgi:hypothetical protein